MTTCKEISQIKSYKDKIKLRTNNLLCSTFEHKKTINEYSKLKRLIESNGSNKKNEYDFTEIWNASLGVNPLEWIVKSQFKTTNKKYQENEFKWYLSTKNALTEELRKVKIWNSICDVNKEVNSNYGQLVFSRSNYSQFDHALECLKKDKYSRRGIILYSRPSIHLESESLGVNDFICTLSQHFSISTNNELGCIVNMRSQDAIFGFFNDAPWFAFVYCKMHKELSKYYKNLKINHIILNVNSFHIYSRHYYILKNFKV